MNATWDKAIAKPLIALQNVTKRFGALYANRDISAEIFEGEIHAFVGENGAGKSTLMKMLFGHFQPDGGAIRIDGEAARFRSPRDAMRKGIGMVHQDLLILPQLTILENIILGFEPATAGVVRSGAARDEIGRLNEHFGFDLPLGRRAQDLSFARQQHMEILRILFRKARILILDEPTGMLAPHEAKRLLDLLQSLRAAGCTVLFVSHRLREVLDIADRITVLRRGRLVATLPAARTSFEEIAGLIVGRNASETEGTRVRNISQEEEEPTFAAAGRPVLELRSIAAPSCGNEPAVCDLSFTVIRGEIFGVCGVVGNGQRTLARALAGACPVTAGQILLHGREITAESISGRLDLGLRWLPANPLEEALLPDRPIWENLLLGRQRTRDCDRGTRRCRGRLLRAGQAIREAGALLEAYDVTAGSALEPVSALSGGNRQKIALARALSGAPSLIVLEQPTRGLDIRASERIYRKLFDLASGGASFILISHDPDELLSVCHRLAVIYRGRIAGIAPRETASRDLLGRWMLGMD